MLPSVFISHGSPMLAIEFNQARETLQEMAAALGRPSAIVAFSPHWMTPSVTIGRCSLPQELHDFYGFDPRLDQLRYRPPGSPQLADQIGDQLRLNGFECRFDERRGLDHGIWIPLSIMWPEADIPVVPISMPWPQTPSEAYHLGQIFQSMREQNVLLLGTGSLTHNLHDFMAMADLGVAAPVAPYVTDFRQWFISALRSLDLSELFNYRVHAPFASQAHPTDEHLLPLFWALGAGGYESTSQFWDGGIEYGVLAMDGWFFGVRSSV